MRFDVIIRDIVASIDSQEVSEISCVDSMQHWYRSCSSLKLIILQNSASAGFPRFSISGSSAREIVQYLYSGNCSFLMS